MLWQNKGQSTVEYAVMAAVVVGALLLMGRYIERGVAGKLHVATDQIGDQFTPIGYTASFGTHSKGTRHELSGVAEDGSTTSLGSTTSIIETEPEIQNRVGIGGAEGSTGEEHITEALTKNDKLLQ